MTLFDALSQALIHSLWQVALIAALLKLIMWLIPGRHASARYIACLSALSLVPLAFLITVFSFLSPSGLHLEPLLASLPLPASIASTLPLVPVWMVGIAYLSVKRIRDWHQIRCLSRQPFQALNGDMARTFEHLRKSLTITRKVEVGISAIITGPCTFGFIRPIILFPISCLTRLTHVEIEALMAHELAHIKRLDYLQRYYQSIVEAVFFFHPGMWVISRQMSAEREHACDDMAVAALGQANPLIHGLLKTGLQQQEAGLLLSARSSSPHSLTRRIHRLLETPYVSRTRTGGLRIALLALTVTILGFSMSSMGGTINPVFANQTGTLDQNQIVLLKDNICTIFMDDGIYVNPKYGGRVVANVRFSRDAILMNGESLPASTHAAVRDVLDQYGLGATNGHLRYFGADVNLIL